MSTHPYQHGTPRTSTKKPFQDSTELQKYQQEDPSVAHLFKIAVQLEGLYRHVSTHAAGIVIGNQNLEETIPLYRDLRSNIPVTQFSMKYVERFGLVKFDFLGLKTLSVLSRSEELIKQRGLSIDIQSIPINDSKNLCST